MTGHRPIRHILVAVKHPHAPASAALAKAAVLARGWRASLELFHGIDVPLYAESYVGSGRELGDDQRDIRADYLHALEVLAAPLRREDLEVQTSAEWDYPSYEAVLRRAQHSKAGLIVCEHHAADEPPRPLHAADWQLLLHSRVPLLAVRTAGRYAHAPVLAAIDPLRAHDKPAALDSEILTLALQLSEALQGSLHVLHATGSGARAAAARAPVEALIAQLPRPPASVLLRAQPPQPAICEAVRELEVAILVMGSMSRSGLKRLLIGNTAERLIDTVACDILVVKPAGFGVRFPEQVRGIDLRALPMPT